MKKILNIISKIVNIFLVIFVILFLITVCLQRFTNNEISFFNYRMFTVASGSMAPEYEVGDVLIAKETAPENIKIGDSITYLGNQGTFAGKTVTHSVTRIEKDQSGKIIFHTKGLANLVEDPPVYQEQVYGVIVCKPEILSFIYKMINTKYGLFIFVILPIFYIIGSEMLSTMLETEEKRRAKMKEKNKKDKEENDEDSNNKKESKSTENKKTEEKKDESENKPKLDSKEETEEIVEDEKTKKSSSNKTKKEKESKEKTPRKRTKKEVK